MDRAMDRQPNRSLPRSFFDLTSFLHDARRPGQQLLVIIAYWFIIESRTGGYETSILQTFVESLSE